MVHIHIHTFKRRAMNNDTIVKPFHFSAHGFQYISKTNVALDTLLTNTGNLNRTTFNGTGRQEV